MKQVFLMFAMLFSALALAGETKPLTFCTGSEVGYYNELGATIGKKIVDKTKGELKLINTGGSVENAELMKDGECVLAVMQGDAVINLPLPAGIKVTDSHEEVIFWIHGPQGLKDFGQIETETNLARYAVAMVSGSGGEVTLTNFGKIDEDYKSVRTVSFDGWDEAAEAAAQGYTMVAGVRVEIAGLLYVGRAGFVNKDIVEDYGDLLTVGDLKDRDFANVQDFNGNKLYSECEVNEDMTSGLKTDNTVSDQETYCVRAQIVYNTDYHKAVGGDEGKALKRTINKAIASTVKAVRQ